MSSRLVSPIGWRKSSAVVGLAVAIVLLVAGSAMAVNLGLLENPSRFEEIEFRPVSELSPRSELIDVVVATSQRQTTSPAGSSAPTDVDLPSSSQHATISESTSAVSDDTQPETPSTKRSGEKAIWQDAGDNDRPEDDESDATDNGADSGDGDGNQGDDDNDGRFDDD